MATQKLTITIDRDLRKWLEMKAKKNGRSLSNYISWQLMKLKEPGRDE